MKKDKEWFSEQIMKKYPSQSEIDNPDYEIIAKIEIIQEALSLIEKLDEPELPVIPQFVADWIEHIKEKKPWLTLSGAFNHSTQQAVGKTKDWILIGNSDLFARAWLDGFVIEKEKMYVVKINDQGSWLYLKSMQLYKDVEERTDLNSNFECWKEKAIKFTNKEQAEGIAKFFNGEVEEVTND